MNTEQDDPMVDSIRSGFAGTTYTRSATTFRHRSRLPYAAGTLVVAALAATIAVVGTDGSHSTALAWSPTPAAVTASDEAAVRSACQTGSATATVGDVAVATKGFAVASGGNGTGGSLPTGGTVVVAGSTGTAVVDTVLSANPPQQPGLPTPPATLPPLVSLDLRGTGGLAVFADKAWTMTCMVVRTSTGFTAGPLMAAPADLRSADGTFAVTTGSGTTWSDGRSLAMLSGTAPQNATTVQLSVPGQAPATANVVGGRFSIWWIGDFGSAKVTLTALDASGAAIGTLSPEMPTK